MRKFVLKYAFIGGPPTGTVVEEVTGYHYIEEKAKGTSKYRHKYRKRDIENNQYWQEITDTFQILSFRWKNGAGYDRTLSNDGTYCITYNNKMTPTGMTLEYMYNHLSEDKYQIKEVKRLSDGVVFKLGDVINGAHTKDTVITYFNYVKINDETREVININNHLIGLLECSLRTSADLSIITHDKVPLKIGSLIIPVKKSNLKIQPKLIFNNISNIREARKNGYLWFSSVEAAQDYILEKKECMSIADMKKIIYSIGLHNNGSPHARSITKNLKLEMYELVNSRINK